MVVAVGFWFASRCPPTEFFGMPFGMACEDDPGGGLRQSEPSETRLMGFWTRSHEFQHEINSAMKEAKDSAWILGTSFHQHIQKYLLLEMIDRGVHLRYLFLNPSTELDNIAKSFGQTAEELKSELDKTFEALKGVYCALEANKQEFLQARLVNQPIGARMYFFDRSDSSDDSNRKIFLVPYLYSEDSPALPGFMFDGQVGDKYLPVANSIWSSAKEWNPGPCPGS